MTVGTSICLVVDVGMGFSSLLVVDACWWSMDEIISNMR
jgi:hypothetical protein